MTNDPTAGNQAASIPPQSPAPGTINDNNQPAMNTYAAYVPSAGSLTAPRTGQPPAKKWLSEEVSIPVLVGSIAVIGFLLLVYLIFYGLRGDTYYASVALAQVY